MVNIQNKNHAMCPICGRNPAMDCEFFDSDCIHPGYEKLECPCIHCACIQCKNKISIIFKD